MPLQRIDMPCRGESAGLKRGSNKCFDCLNRTKEDLKIEQGVFNCSVHESEKG